MTQKNHHPRALSLNTLKKSWACEPHEVITDVTRTQHGKGTAQVVHVKPEDAGLPAEPKPDPDYDCERHETDYPSGYDHCPLCRREQDRQQMIQERAARRADPDMHPTVDAPRR